jgi:hypothetical protein
MTSITRIGGGLVGPASYGTPQAGVVVGAHAWRVRPFPGQSVPAGPSATDAPMKPPHVSASERCP